MPDAFFDDWIYNIFTEDDAADELDYEDDADSSPGLGFSSDEEPAKDATFEAMNESD